MLLNSFPKTYDGVGSGTLILERVLGLKNSYYCCPSTPNTKVPITSVLGTQNFAISYATKYPSKLYKFEGHLISINPFAIMVVFAKADISP